MSGGVTQGDWRTAVAGEIANAGAAMSLAADAKESASEAGRATIEVAKRVAQAAPVWRANVEITYSGLISLSLAPRLASFSIASAKAGDRCQVFASAEPTLAGLVLAGGYDHCDHAVCYADGVVKIRHVIPAVGVGQTLKIPLLLVAYRDV